MAMDLDSRIDAIIHSGVGPMVILKMREIKYGFGGILRLLFRNTHILMLHLGVSGQR